MPFLTFALYMKEMGESNPELMNLMQQMTKNMEENERLHQQEAVFRRNSSDVKIEYQKKKEILTKFEAISEEEKGTLTEAHSCDNNLVKLSRLIDHFDVKTVIENEQKLFQIEFKELLEKNKQYYLETKKIYTNMENRKIVKKLRQMQCELAQAQEQLKNTKKIAFKRDARKQKRLYAALDSRNNIIVVIAKDCIEIQQLQEEIIELKELKNEKLMLVKKLKQLDKGVDKRSSVADKCKTANDDMKSFDFLDSLDSDINKFPAFMNALISKPMPEIDYDIDYEIKLLAEIEKVDDNHSIEDKTEDENDVDLQNNILAEVSNIDENHSIKDKTEEEIIPETESIENEKTEIQIDNESIDMSQQIDESNENCLGEQFTDETMQFTDETMQFTEETMQFIDETMQVEENKNDEEIEQSSSANAVEENIQIKTMEIEENTPIPESNSFDEPLENKKINESQSVNSTDDMQNSNPNALMNECNGASENIDDSKSSQSVEEAQFFKEPLPKHSNGIKEPKEMDSQINSTSDNLTEDQTEISFNISDYVNN